MFALKDVFKTLALAGVMLIGVEAMAENVTINPAAYYQSVRGFGGMNAPGWINDLTTTQVNTAYGSGEGQLGLSIMRMRIDPDSANWKIQVAAAKRAKELGAILFATPWTPPAYMKSNKSLISGGKLLTQYYGDYTTHLLNFANYMSNNGASLYAVSIQNEPDWHPDYESCDWTGDEFAAYLAAHGSKFGSLKVIAPESLGFITKYSDPILNNASAEPHVDIIGGHLYGVQPKDYPLARQKGKELWMTEHYTESKNSGDAWPLALDVGTELHKSMVANYNAYVWWYVRRSYGLLLENGNVSKRGYIMSQYARFVRPGSVRIFATETPHADVSVTAYKRPDNKIVIVAVNTGTAHRNLDIKLQSGSPAAFVKYSTSATLNVGYGGRVAVSNSAGTLWVDPQSVATFISEDTAAVTATPTTTLIPTVAPTKLAASSTPTPTKVAATATPLPTKVAATSTPTPTKVAATSTPRPTKTATATPVAVSPTLLGTSDYPTSFSKCADLGGTCSVSSGTGWAAFGRKGKWVTKYVGTGKSTACTVAAFGADPGGNPNKCSYQK